MFMYLSKFGMLFDPSAKIILKQQKILLWDFKPLLMYFPKFDMLLGPNEQINWNDKKSSRGILSIIMYLPNIGMVCMSFTVNSLFFFHSFFMHLESHVLVPVLSMLFTAGSISKIERFENDKNPEKDLGFWVTSILIRNRKPQKSVLST